MLYKLSLIVGDDLRSYYTESCNLSELIGALKLYCETVHGYTLCVATIEKAGVKGFYRLKNGTLVSVPEEKSKMFFNEFTKDTLKVR